MFALPSPATQVISWSKFSSQPLAAVVLADVKTWLNRPLEDTYWDAETTTLIIVAVRSIEQYCEMTIAPSVLVGHLPDFPGPSFRLDARPFRSVTSIEYVEPLAGEIITVPATDYLAQKAPQATGWLDLADTASWPATAKRRDAVRITVEAGFTALPDDIKHAIAVTVAHLDKGRGDGDGGSGGRLANTAQNSSGPSVIPGPAKALLAPYKLMTFRAF
jgi:hypothetical protein